MTTASQRGAGLTVFKGHGTGNDFVLIPDLDGVVDLTDELVRRLCDRHTGIGGDGVLRVVGSQHAPEAAGMAASAPYFMDYRNADGSVAEMCGNGARVFVAYLQRAGLVGASTAIATRGGVRLVETEPSGKLTVEMGGVTWRPERPAVDTRDGSRFTGVALEIPNPHVVIRTADEQELAGLDLTTAPSVTPALPHGQNVEFVAVLGHRHIALRVHERGVGETLSCGTGICAAVAATSAALVGATGDRGAGEPEGELWRVDVPGGTCHVRLCPDGTVRLTGPAELVAEIVLDPQWLARAGA